MIDVLFHLNNLSLIPNACIDSENSVKESFYELGELIRKLKTELSSFSEYSREAISNIQAHISEISSLIGAINQKSAAAQSRKQQESPPTPKPSIPANATPEQKSAMESKYREQAAAEEKQNEEVRENNQRIDEYCSRCNAAKQELEALLADLHQLEASLRSESAALMAEADEFCRKAQRAADQSGRINTAMSEFSRICDMLLEAAQKLYDMKASEISGYSYVDRLFTVKNTHVRHASSAVPSFSSGAEWDTEATAVKPADNDHPAAGDELLITAKDKNSFFVAAHSAIRIKMPSANLHRLGGKAFTAEMNALGFFTVPQSDGSLIDLNGMIHWEKQDNGHS